MTLDKCDALIGYTGFVGSNLRVDEKFREFYNSRNIDAIVGRRFGRVVCAGVSAVKWWANKHPEEDLAQIRGLMERLDRIEADHFVLISTADVYKIPNAVTESIEPPRDGLHPYGLNRLLLEDFVRDRFSTVQIVRLPALFGTGLKKNALFDMIHRNQTEAINPLARFQWYPVGNLVAHLDKIAAAGIDLINIVAEPIETATIRDAFFPEVRIGSPSMPAPYYNIRSEHDKLLGGRDGYHLSAAEVMEQMRSFVVEQKAAAAAGT